MTTLHSELAYFVPARARGVLVLAHGYPWPDDSRSLPELAEHARGYVERWRPFAEEHCLILLAPAFGSGKLAGYRELFGRRIDPDELVNRLVDAFGGRFVEGFDGRFLLYGHSAGGQFASRYLVAHPRRLQAVILSAPSTYPFPESAVAWPYGMAPVERTADEPELFFATIEDFLRRSVEWDSPAAAGGLVTAPRTRQADRPATALQGMSKVMACIVGTSGVG